MTVIHIGKNLIVNRRQPIYVKGVQVCIMIRVRLFRSERPVGFLRLNEREHSMRPEGVLPDDAVQAIRKDLALGRIAGLSGLCTWYRQATAFCPLDPQKACPCDDEVCGVGTPPWNGIKLH